MKIRKSEWEAIGKKAGWTKKANYNDHEDEINEMNDRAIAEAWNSDGELKEISMAINGGSDISEYGHILKYFFDSDEEMNSFFNI